MSPPGDTVFRRIMSSIEEERLQQDAKWGLQRLDSDRWNTILVEEVGEASKAINDGDKANLKVELIQVAAVAVAWLTDIRLTEAEGIVREQRR